MTSKNRCDLAHDLVLPTLLFAALGGMTWAVRGSSGFGATPGCIFAGIVWGAAWWYIARDPAREQSRRYSSAWIVLAVTVGLGISGARGWMQWPAFFEGKLMTNYEEQQFVPIDRAYGFLWLFIAGVPWAGLCACMLAWCGSLRETRAWHWALRIGCGIGAGMLARYLYVRYPQYFLPLYESLGERYQEAMANPDTTGDPNLRRLMNDNGAALTHLGYYLGFLLYEVGRRDWKNAVLIVTVGVVNGAGWALCQNWSWATRVWGEDAKFNWWRCWESSGGISIGIALGSAYFLVNRRMSDRERAIVASRRAIAGPNFEWLLIFLGLASLMSLFLRFQFGGAGRVVPIDGILEFTHGRGESVLVPLHSTLSSLGAYVRTRMGGWGGLYFSIVMVFAAAYYVLYRGTSVEQTTTTGHWADAIVNALAAVCLTGALVASFYPVGPRLMDRLIGFLSELGVSVDLGRYVNLGRYYAFVIACGLAWCLIRRRSIEAEKIRGTPVDGDPNLERLGLYLGLLLGLGLSLRNGLKGWFNIYIHNEGYWSAALWQYLGPVFLVCLLVIVLRILSRPLQPSFRGDIFPRAYGAIWLVLIVQNTIAQLITGPPTAWNEMAFSIYYLLLFGITATIVLHFHTMKSLFPPPEMPSAPT